MKTYKLRFLSYFVIAYMILAFSWWTVLLFIKNQDAFRAKKEHLLLVTIADRGISSFEEFEELESYQKLKEEYDKQYWMILGEATVFVISIVLGTWLINRAFHKEVLAAQQKRNFLLSITHELKSPIASIQLVLETIKKRRTLDESRLLQLTNSGLKESGRLFSLVSDLLLAAKMETTYEPYLERVNLEVVLNDIVDKFSVSYPEATLQLEVDEQLPNIKADLFGLTTIAHNLIENAIKYSPSPAHVKIVAKGQKQWLDLKFIDEGIGIEEAQKKQVFQQFYRIGNEDTRKTKGTGLGLYIVHQLVKAQGGKIKITDNKPKGTIFHIEMPIRTFFSTIEQENGLVLNQS